MQRTLCLLLTLGLATTALLPSLQAHEEDAFDEVKLFLNRGEDGKLGLTSLAPSSRNATTWTTGGHYYTSEGLKVEIRLTDPNPNWVLDEDRGATGWVQYSFKQTKGGSLLSPLQGYNYGSFAWTLVEGERSSPMTHECATWNETYDYRCDAYHYQADFPGHGAKPTPHTHGDGTDAERGLMSGDLEWVLTYTVPPCTSSTCFLGGQQMKWEFSIVLDGTTFLQYAAIDEEHPVEAPVDPAAGNATDNDTEAGNETAGDDPSGAPGNETGNETGNGSEGNSFRPRAYNAQGADGTAPGAGIGAILATIGVASVMMRRRRA